jgi:hypothetical protein
LRNEVDKLTGQKGGRASPLGESQMKRAALVIAVTIFVAAWMGGGRGPIGRWLALVGLLASERFAVLSVTRGVRPSH